MGAEAVRELLKRCSTWTSSGRSCAGLAETNSKQKQKDLSKRLKIVEQPSAAAPNDPSGWCST
jgi:hypothetical protein